MNAIFISDVHLRDAGSVKTGLVMRFFQEVASGYEHIYILGDLFDVWPGTTDYLIRTFQPVLNVFKELVKEGHKLHYLEGNHDFKLGEYFSNELGIKVYTDKIEENWNGKRIFMAHGDLGNPKELGYRVLRRVLRMDALHLALKQIPAEWIFQVGMKSSQMSRNYQKKLPKAESAIRQIYRSTAEKIFEEGYDVVIMGHTHLPDDVTTMVSNRPCRYINTGDWVRHFTYLEFDGEQFYTKTHPVTNH